mgnify:CR=1 FL=1
MYRDIHGTNDRESSREMVIAMPVHGYNIKKRKKKTACFIDRVAGYESRSCPAEFSWHEF